MYKMMLKTHVFELTAVQNKIPFWEVINLKAFKAYLHRKRLDEPESHNSYKEHQLRKKWNAPRGGDSR